jgi:hypothetical protein
MIKYNEDREKISLHLISLNTLQSSCADNFLDVFVPGYIHLSPKTT